MSLCKLTVCFEEPFWVGIVETENNGAYSVARHVFGAEPTTPEVFSFICDHWNDLALPMMFRSRSQRPNVSTPNAYSE